jgi:hypothetical protein
MKEQSAKAKRRLGKEARTVEAMVRIWCADRHGGTALCEECAALLEYTSTRVSRCPHGEHKPACKDCAIHCFREPQRGDMQQVMRYAGPRMAKKHPLMALQHLYVRWKAKKRKK